MNSGTSKITGHHNQHHGVVKLVDFDVLKVIENDGKLAQDRSTTRAHFQGRFRKTTFGDFKNHSGRNHEMVQAQIEDHEREDVKAEEVAAQAAVVEAAAAKGVVVEDVDLHRLDDDGGPANA